MNGISEATLGRAGHGKRVRLDLILGQGTDVAASGSAEGVVDRRAPWGRWEAGRSRDLRSGHHSGRCGWLFLESSPSLLTRCLTLGLSLHCDLQVTLRHESSVLSWASSTFHLLFSS